MQTFLPYPSFRRSARVLDRQRLGKQRVEAMQILNVLHPPRGKKVSGGWRNHPAVLMWGGYEGALAEYCVSVCDEWISRGYKDTIRARVLRRKFPVESYRKPRWIKPMFCASHRSNLLRKDPVHYGQFGWKEKPNMEYVWPVKRPAE